MAELRVIKFSSELQRELWPDNSFYKKSQAETGIGVDVETVQIPQAGNAGVVGVGVPGALPLTIAERTDDTLTYPVSQLYMEEPILVTDENELVISYQKRQDVIRAMADAINTKAGDIAATEWAPATATGFTVPTSGTATRTTEIVGGTGLRKKVDYADLVALRGIINRQNTPPGKWYGLMSAAQLDDLFEMDKITDYERTQIAMIRTGEVGMLFGMSILMRHNEALGHSGVSWDVAGVVKAVGAAAAATDNSGSIFWHERMVRHAEGNAKAYIDRDKPEYLGTVVNAKVRFGATQNRLDFKGTAALIDAPSP